MGMIPDPRQIGGGGGGGPPIPGKSGIIMISKGMGVDPRSPANRRGWDPHPGSPANRGWPVTRRGTGMGVGGSVPWAAVGLGESVGDNQSAISPPA
jgi:hypothetical protein